VISGRGKKMLFWMVLGLSGRTSPKYFKICLWIPIFIFWRARRVDTVFSFLFFQVICSQFVEYPPPNQTFCWKLKSNRCHKSEIFIQFCSPFLAPFLSHSLDSSITFMCFGFLRAILLLRTLKLIYVVGKRRKTKIMKASESKAFHAELCLSAGDY